MCAAKAGGSATSSRDAPVPRKEPGNDDARAALLELSAAFAALPASFLDRISADQNRDLRDSVCDSTPPAPHHICWDTPKPQTPEGAGF